MVKNSWGASWGVDGYMMIAADGNVANLCTNSYDRQVVEVTVLQ